MCTAIQPLVVHQFYYQVNPITFGVPENWGSYKANDFLAMNATARFKSSWWAQTAQFQSRKFNFSQTSPTLTLV